MHPVTQIMPSDINAATQHVLPARSAEEDIASSYLTETGQHSKIHQLDDISPAGPTITTSTTQTKTYPTDTASFAFETEPIDLPHLRQRLHTYGAVYNLPHDAVRQMDELLATPLVRRLLAAPALLLYEMLVQDTYKPRMHVMYDRFMTGVTADFALVVRRTPPLADPARLPVDRPALWARFEAAAEGVSRTTPYGPYEVAALRDLFGLELPQSLLERCHRDGVAAVSWQERHTEGGAGRVAIASGPIISSSLVETTLMQRFQSLAVAAQSRSAGGGTQPPLSRTERLASSLARLVDTVNRINELNHGCKVALFAGRRSSDLLYLVLQNVYCAAHLAGYVGTSSLFAAAVIGRLQAAEGQQVEVKEASGPAPGDEEDGKGAVEDPEEPTEGRTRVDRVRGSVQQKAAAYGGLLRLLGTHAHEQVSAVQQLLSSYDVEAGRRCGLPHAVAVTPLLAHLLFLAANGPDVGSGGGGGGGGVRGVGGTALADTFTTSAFLAVSRVAAVPAAFRADVAAAFGWVIPDHARCFDLFSTWRVDSGCYEWVAEQVMAAWEGRCLELAAEGLPGLRRPQLMHSNLESVEHIAQVCELAPRIKPAILAFGTLADGFLPFLPADEEKVEKAEAKEERGHRRPHPHPKNDNSDMTTAPAVPAPTLAPTAARPTLSLASVVMKLVQARPPRPILQLPTSQPPSASSVPLSSSAGPPGSAPLCAVKLGDGHHSGKAQVDPRMAPEEAAAALAAAADMAHGSACSPLDSAAISAVLAEAYEAVTRGGILLEAKPAGSAGTIRG